MTTFVQIFNVIPELRKLNRIDTALRNHNRIVFEEMSSLIALTMHLGMKTTFYTKYI